VRKLTISSCSSLKAVLSMRALHFGQSRGPFDIARCLLLTRTVLTAGRCRDCGVIQTPQSTHYAHDVQCRFQNVRGMRLEHIGRSGAASPSATSGTLWRRERLPSLVPPFLFGVRHAAGVPIIPPSAGTSTTSHLSHHEAAVGPRARARS